MHDLESKSTQPHHTPRNAQSAQVPALINGRLDKSGRLDCYSLMASEGDELKLEVIQAQELKPRLSLLGPSSSWFNAERLERQLSLEERQSDLVPRKNWFRWPSCPPKQRFAEKVHPGSSF